MRRQLNGGLNRRVSANKVNKNKDSGAAKRSGDGGADGGVEGGDGDHAADGTPRKKRARSAAADPTKRKKRLREETLDMSGVFALLMDQTQDGHEEPTFAMDDNMLWSAQIGNGCTPPKAPVPQVQGQGKERVGADRAMLGHDINLLIEFRTDKENTKGATATKKSKKNVAVRGQTIGAATKLGLACGPFHDLQNANKGGALAVVVAPFFDALQLTQISDEWFPME